MATPCIPNPYAALACYALCRPLGDVSVRDIDVARVKARGLRYADPPLLPKFLEQYPAILLTTAQKQMMKVNASHAEEVEGLLQCIWRGDYEDVFNLESGPYVHFKGVTYLVYGKALLLQGPKEEPVVVYSSKEGEIFVRPLREWVEVVKWPDGKYRPRFRKEG
jgi:hypothetical protein